MIEITKHPPQPRRELTAHVVIRGPDGKDNKLIDVPFSWDAGRDVRELRVGHLSSAFEPILDDPNDTERVSRAKATQQNNRIALEDIRRPRVELVPFDLPDVAIDAADALGFIP